MQGCEITIFFYCVLENSVTKEQLCNSREARERKKIRHFSFLYAHIKSAGLLSDESTDFFIVPMIGNYTFD